MKSPNPLEIGQELSLTFDVPQTGKVFPITATVRHIRSGAYGIEIIDFGASPQEYQSLVEAWFCLHSLDLTRLNCQPLGTPFFPYYGMEFFSRY